MDLKIDSIKVEAKPRKLKTRYTLESAEDLKSIHSGGRSGEEVLEELMQSVKAKEILDKPLTKEEEVYKED